MVFRNACARRSTLRLIFFFCLFSVIFTIAYISTFNGTKITYVIPETTCEPPDFQQNFNTENNSSTNFSLIVVVQVHKRGSYLKELISSLSISPDICNVFLIFSHDYYDDYINNLISDITFCRHEQIFYPYAPEAAANHTNTTSEPKVSQMKLHWWWKANEAFRIAESFNYSGQILFLEEDHFVIEDFVFVLHQMQEISHKYCSNCVYSLSNGSNDLKSKSNKFQISKKMSGMGLAFNATTWATITACADRFCKYNDYNWDWTINYIFQECVQPQPKALIMSGSRVLHIGKCGVHFKDQDCDATKLVKEFQKQVKKYSALLYPKELEYVGDKIEARIWQNYGGFDNKEDQELCLRFSACNDVA